MKISSRKNAGLTLLMFTLLMLIFVIVFVFIGVIRSLVLVSKNRQDTGSVSNQFLGRPASFTNLTPLTYLTVLGVHKGNDGIAYVVALVGTNDMPTLFSAGTNWPNQVGIYLYDGKRILPMPKLE